MSTVYRPFHQLAVPTFLLGVLSGLAWFSLLLAIIPLASLVLGVWALRAIRANPNEFTGRSWTVAGLLLGMFFLTASFTRHLAEQRMVVEQARRFAERWLVLLQHEQLSTAHQYTLTVENRSQGNGDLVSYYRDNFKSREARDDFGRQPLVRELLQARGNFEFAFDQVLATEALYQELGVALRYRVQVPHEGKPEKQLVDIQLRRELKPNTPACWRVMEIKPAKKAR